MTMSIERRRLAVMSGATVAVSGLHGVLQLQRPPWLIAWMALECIMIAGTIVALVRWKRRARRSA